MRKYYFIAAAALVVLAACQKKGNEVQENQTPGTSVTTVPAWLEDESLPVPIEMGKQGLFATKGLPIASSDFNDASFRYSVIALRESDDAVMSGFEGGVLARNAAGDENTATGDDLTGNTVVQFLDAYGADVTKYYPYMYSDGTFNFYGYRVDGNAPTLSGTSINGIQMGPNDILWAKAEAQAADETAARVGNASVNRDYESNGFSARYIRGIRREYVANNHGGMSAYVDALPHLDFEHVTSQVKFVIKAFDAIAEATLADASVAVSSIVIGGTDAEYPTATAIASTANLNIKTGAFTQNQTGTISVTNIANDFAILETGTQCGDPLFIMPFSGNILFTMVFTLPTGGTQTIKTVLTAPAVPADNIPAGTFAPGYVYKFTVSLESIEKINIITTLQPWGTEVEADPVVID